MRAYLPFANNSISWRSFIIEPPVAEVYSPYAYSIKNKDALHTAPHMFMYFHVEPDSDYSISDSPEPDLKTLCISLHRYYTLYLLVPLSTWPDIPVHVNLTSPHPATEIYPQI
jgi:hypothetical protein